MRFKHDERSGMHIVVIYAQHHHHDAATNACMCMQVERYRHKPFHNLVKDTSRERRV